MEHVEHGESVQHLLFQCLQLCVYRILDRETTEDIVSDVFMKVLRHLERFDAQKASMKSWIMRIADRTLIDHYRRQRPSVSFDHEEAGVERLVPVHFEDQYEQLMSPARREQLAALKQLPERERCSSTTGIT